MKNIEVPIDQQLFNNVFDLLSRISKTKYNKYIELLKNQKTGKTL